jgi:tRNA A37 threonylcarbamoyladenosine dehydratase
MSMIRQTLNNYSRSIRINDIANSNETQIAKNFRSTKLKKKEYNKRNLDAACSNFSKHESFKDQLKYKSRQRYLFRQH